jgi:hypothetical protein
MPAAARQDGTSEGGGCSQASKTVSARHAWAGSCQAVPGERMGHPIKRVALHKVREGVWVALRAVIACCRAWEGWEHR